MSFEYEKSSVKVLCLECGWEGFKDSTEVHWVVGDKSTIYDLCPLCGLNNLEIQESDCGHVQSSSQTVGDF